MGEPEARAVASEIIAGWNAEAERIAAQKRAANRPVEEYEVVITEVRRISRTWCVFYNSRRFVETGEPSAALAGNGPIMVNDDGEARTAGSARSAEDYVVEFESTVNP